MNKTSTQIAGWKTAEDWINTRSSLVISGDHTLWRKAYEDFYLTRLNLRYFDPIRVLQDNGTYRGEGFSILAIHCSLIEFLESTVQGITYRYLRNGETLGPHEYNSSKKVFTDFLTKRIPFNNEFNEPLATDFYISVRCGLLHEARTKNGWTINAKNSTDCIVDSNNRIVFRNDFHRALERFTEWYGAALQTDAALQAAFIRKFNDLCQ